MPNKPSSRDHPPPSVEHPPATPLPIMEAQQPDPMMQTGRLGAVGISIAAVVVAIVLGVVLYGLNEHTADNTAAPPSTTAAGQNPAAGGNSGAATPGAPRANESGVKG